MKIKPFQFQYQIGENETCFSYLPKFAAEIDAAADEFLAQFDFVPSDEIAADIDKRAWKIFTENDKDFDKVPEWVADVIDQGIPFCSPPRNGSLWFSLGRSVASQDAHLRMFWENIKNDTDFRLPFPVIVPKNIEETNKPIAPIQKKKKGAK